MTDVTPPDAAVAEPSTPKLSMRACGNLARQASAVASHTALRRPQMATSAPSSRNFSAIDWPSPVPPPVTSMRWPFINCGWNMRVSLWCLDRNPL